MKLRTGLVIALIILSGAQLCANGVAIFDGESGDIMRLVNSR